ncbi:MAG: hypothetical protein U0172_03975 [Nitrospiraceae bacterium]
MTTAANDHIEITATMVRLYVFLSQYLDRCVSESACAGLAAEELQKHLDATRKELLGIVSVNPVVKAKMTAESDRVLALGAECFKSGDKCPSMDALNAERAILKNKTMALSDLLAVFRAL